MPNKLARLIRFTKLPDQVITSFDDKNNLMLIDRESFDALSDNEKQIMITKLTMEVPA